MKTITVNLIILGLLFTTSAMQAEQQPVSGASPKMLSDRYVIDVRTDDEWNAGHIEGAIHIPVTQVKVKIETVTKDKKAPLGLYCASGMRSGRAVKILKELGYETVENLGGMGAAKKKLEPAK